MNAITVAGGVYHERCIWPDWDQIYGSAGRAAAALTGHVAAVSLRTYATAEVAAAFQPYAASYGIVFDPISVGQAISFEYVHSLSIPTVRPTQIRIRKNLPISVKAEVSLRFGMLEGTAVVEAARCIYDPQSAFAPEPFAENGSRAPDLAIVANRGEVIALGNDADPMVAARTLLNNGARVVVIKSGVEGAFVVEPTGLTHVPAIQTKTVWTIGSGDVFAAMFAARWGVHGDDAPDAARLAARAVAEYVESMALPIPPVDTLKQARRSEAKATGGRIYLAGPFFTLSQRWLVDEARRCMIEFGLEVFSPAHEVGPGPAEKVTPADLAAIDSCDAVFAILDGIDSGTLFEVGYARAKEKPVYALAQTVSEEDLKLIVGSSCHLFDDFVTALHHLAWRE